MAVGVVLGGGGPLAVAWESGIASGLASRDVMLGSADRILGTSAGAIVGARLAAGCDPHEMAGAIIAEADEPPPPGRYPFYQPEALAMLSELFARAHSSTAGRAEVGAYALQAATLEDETAHVARIEHHLGPIGWPDRYLGITVVDAQTGETVVLDRSSGATLAQAVAASCSLPGLSPTVGIGGRRYLDGGLRSTLNADLMTGGSTVVLLCFIPPGPRGERILATAQAQKETLELLGAAVTIISPDAAALDAIGSATMDVMRRPGVTIAGRAQGARLAADLPVLRSMVER